MTLSVCSIVKNGAEQLVSYVSKVRPFADEIIIVDNGSEDGSGSLAQQLGCRVISCMDEFDLARNAYLAMATGDWILSLDIDEEILPTHFQTLRNHLHNLQDDRYCGVICLPRYDYFGNGKWSVWYLSRVIRNIGNVHYNTSMHGAIAKNVLSRGYRAAYIYAPIQHYDGLQSEEVALKKRERNIRLLEENIKKYPLNPKLRIRLATEYCALEKYDVAIMHAQRGCELDVGHVELAYEQLARVYFCMGKYDKCMEEIDRQIGYYIEKINSGVPYAIRYYKSIDFCNTIRVNTYYRLGDIENAILTTEQNISFNPELAHNYVNYYILSPERKDMLQKAIDLNPNLLNKQIYWPERKWTLYNQSSAILPHCESLINCIRTI